MVLVGLMGVGKSTVGRRLARRLGLPFIDSDSEIEETVGLPWGELFERYGEADYRDRIQGLRAYLTPEFAESIEVDYTMKLAQRELQNRQRAVYEVPGRVYAPDRVRIDSADRWVVYLDLQVIETYRGETVKNTAVRYPLEIVRYDVDPEQNPFGLALAGLESAPERLVLATPDGPEAGNP